MLTWDNVPGAIQYHVKIDNSSRTIDTNRISINELDKSKDHHITISGVGNSCKGEPMEILLHKKPEMRFYATYGNDGLINETIILCKGKYTMKYGLTFETMTESLIFTDEVKIASSKFMVFCFRLFPKDHLTFPFDNVFTGQNLLCASSIGGKLTKTDIARGNEKCEKMLIITRSTGPYPAQYIVFGNGRLLYLGDSPRIPTGTGDCPLKPGMKIISYIGYIKDGKVCAYDMGKEETL